MLARKFFLACGILSSLLYVGMNVFVPMQGQGTMAILFVFGALAGIDGPKVAVVVFAIALLRDADRMNRQTSR